MSRDHAPNVRIGGYHYPICGRNSSAGVSQLSLDATPILEVLVQASPNNASNVELGDHVTWPIELVPGASITIPIDNMRKIWVNLQQGDYLNWMALTC